VTLARMRHLVTQPLQVLGAGDKRQQFLPQVGMSMQAVLPDLVEPLDVLNEVEHRAMEDVRRLSQPAEQDSVQQDDQLDTTW
jgi:hypothetical protein